jgi:general secretion pathway protein B
MSYLLESLKKLEEKRQGVTSSDLLAVRVDTKRRSRKRHVWLYVLSVALFANAGVAVWWLAPSGKQRAESPVATAAVSPPSQAKIEVQEKVVTPRPADVTGKIEVTKEQTKSAPPGEKVIAAPAAPKAPVKTLPEEKKAMVTENTPPAAPAQRPAKAAETSTAATISKPASPQPKTETTANDRSEPAKGAPPELRLSLHSYSPDPPSRLVRINDRNLKEGDTLMPGIKVEEILPDGVIITVEGRKMRLGVGTGH